MGEDKPKQESAPSVTQATVEVDEPSSFSMTARSHTSSRSVGSLPGTVESHDEKMDYFTATNAIWLIKMFVFIIVGFVLLDIAVAWIKIDLENGLLTSAIEICKSCLAVLLGYVFGSRHTRGNKN